ncbi:aspartate/glutamate racemase family protein [Acuticoccus sp. M5D2P5]|uniref:aspartate/glutamate racemase family protein n=1 Tax=Acuticoccus kalidii TaxID=2910977 RepID=UPI001F1CA9EF|nr:aspartate/glutamate racemase family protein [Acuticoccus kalidii]MCF3934750.1 aspartate/glutamate racemase family protein [Acuticoccus kalidii]
MKIKVINPNTTWSMTEKIGAAARDVAAAGTEIVAVSPQMGPVSIEGHYDEAFAAIGVIDEVLKGEAEGCDGYVVACFGDPGLGAAREIAKGPVIGIAEAAMHAASFLGGGFSIVSTLERSRPLMEHLVTAYGMTHQCRSIRMTDLPVLDLEVEGSNAEALVLEECRKAVEEDGADCVLLGCAGMADLTARISREIGAPAVDGVAAGVKFVESLVALGLGTSKRHGYAAPLAKPYEGAFSAYAPGNRR